MSRTLASTRIKANRSIVGLRATCINRGIYQSQDIIPANRRIDWTYAGIPGGIPIRNTIYTTISAVTYGNGVTDATAAIQTALDNCPMDQVVYLPAGTYIVSDHLYMHPHNILRGAGMGVTNIKFTGAPGAQGIYMEIFVLEYDTHVAVTLANKGDMVITIASTAGITVGDVLLIDQLNDGVDVDAVGSNGQCTFCGPASGARSLGQLVEVTSIISSSQVGINIPLFWTYNPDLTPWVYILLGQYITRWAGLEEMTLTQDNAVAWHELEVSFAQYCWVKNVEFANAYRMNFYFAQSLQCEICGCYFHDTVSTVGLGSGYGIELSYNSSSNLIYNNIASNLSGGGFETAAGASGNVLSYNYMNNIILGDPTWLMGSPVLCHGAHPIMNLWEGNIAYSAAADFIWGSSGYNTVFRSRSKGWKDPATVQANNAVYLGKKQYYYNIIGNVLGTSGKTNCYQKNYGDTYDYYTDIPIYLIGMAFAGAPGDANVLPTILRHGNYDYFTNTTIWDASISNHMLPASLYLTSQPVWWDGSVPWPPIGPDVSGLVNQIPAEKRFLAM